MSTACSADAAGNSAAMPPAIPFRTGIGYDVHPLRAGLPLMVGGILIPHDKGAAGHSDADTLIHAICDALLGAAALGDIGVLFPDTDDRYKGIDSKILLAHTAEHIRDRGFEIGNIDCTVCLQRPKLRPYIPQMADCLAQVLHIAPEQISVKATTTEHLGFVGREEGIAAYATALLVVR